MKARIGSRFYDTEKARLVGAWCSSLPASDPDWGREDLFCKRSGEYFTLVELAGERSINPLSHEEAEAWVRLRLGDEAVDREFGEGDADAREVLHVDIRRAAKRRLLAVERSTGVPKARIVEGLLMGLSGDQGGERITTRNGNAVTRETARALLDAYAPLARRLAGLEDAAEAAYDEDDAAQWRAEAEAVRERLDGMADVMRLLGACVVVGSDGSGKVIFATPDGAEGSRRNAVGESVFTISE